MALAEIHPLPPYPGDAGGWEARLTPLRPVPSELERGVSLPQHVDALYADPGRAWASPV